MSQQLPSLDQLKAHSGPFLCSEMQIEPDWIDYNGHLNMAYYNVMMDRAIDQMWLHLGIGPTYMKAVSYTHLTLPTNREV